MAKIKTVSVDIARVNQKKIWGAYLKLISYTESKAHFMMTYSYILYDSVVIGTVDNHLAKTFFKRFACCSRCNFRAPTAGEPEASRPRYLIFLFKSFFKRG